MTYGNLEHFFVLNSSAISYRGYHSGIVELPQLGVTSLLTTVSLVGFGFHLLGKRRNKGRHLLGVVIQFHRKQFSSCYVGKGQCS